MLRFLGLAQARQVAMVVVPGIVLLALFAWPLTRVDSAHAGA